MTVDHLILGFGLTARYLSENLLKAEPKAQIVSTSRKGHPHCPFDLSDPTTWDNLPKAKTTFWTFPPEPFDRVKEFYSKHQGKFGKLIVVGSTSSIEVSQSGQWVTEATSLSLESERAKSEQFLREQGAVLVLSAGIYGPERNPLDWVRKGYVGKSDKWVNMVHLVDLAQFLVGAAKYGEAGGLYIASDGNPQQWAHVIDRWEERGLLSDTPGKASNRTSKRIDNSKSIKDLRVNLQFQNFADSVS